MKVPFIMDLFLVSQVSGPALPISPGAPFGP
jgi:hypothetical protein